jgi:CNT family concentrative nucleoside transporter
MLALQSLAGVVALPLIAWLISEDRRAATPGVMLRRVAFAIAAQFLIAAVLLRIPAAALLFEALGSAVRALQAATLAGMSFVFGYLGGGPAPFAETAPANSFTLAFRALPLILVMSVLSRVLYHWRVLPAIVRAIAGVLSRGFGISAPLGIAAGAKVFLGMVEAPLLIRPYLKALGRGELFALMTVGMATVAGTVFALYAAILEPVVPGAAGHVLAASLMNVPAALTIARLMVPEGFAEDHGRGAAVALELDTGHSTMEAIARGTSDGLKLLAHVVAMLVVMVALVALANMALGAALKPFALEMTFQKALGLLASPFAVLIGIPVSEAATAGALIGEKIVLNELLAYLDLARLPADALSPRSRTIMTYALCGFANLGSIGIMVGGLSAMVPERRAEIAGLAMRSLLSGVMATLLTAAVVGVITP